MRDLIGEFPEDMTQPIRPVIQAEVRNILTVPRVYVVIVTYNGQACIKECLESVVRDPYPARVLVVDNGSSDKTVSFVREFPSVTCIRLSSNLGFGRANNIAMARALAEGAEYIFLLNQDARLCEGAIEILVERAEAHPDFGILSPMQLDSDGRRIENFFALHIMRGQRVGAGFNDFMSDCYRGCVKEIYSLPFLNAAAWLVSRRCVEGIGGFDPIFFHYGEDVDLCNRAYWHGFKVGLVPAARVIHRREKVTASAAKPWLRPRLAISRRQAGMVVKLKEPGSKFAISCLSLINETCYNAMSALIRAQPRSLISLFSAASLTALSLPRIWIHRRKSLVPGCHWL